jgi:hypothetical protein
MSERDDQPTSETPAEREQSAANPFAERDEVEEQPQMTLSKKRAAAWGTAFGLGMALLALVCVALSFALSTCTA